MQQAKQLFNQRARSWDRQHPQDPEQIRAILHLCGLEPGGIVLDVGCGTGVLEPYLLALNPSRILAVDFAEEMIEVARRKLRHPLVDYVCADVMELEGPLCDSCFLYNAFPHFPDPAQLLEHLASLLRPGGRLVIAHSSQSGGRAAGNLCEGPLPLAAEATLKLTRPHFLVDALVDNRALFLLSGVRK